MKHWGAPIILVLMWSVVIVVLTTPEAENGHGVAHPTIKTMDQGDDGLKRHERLIGSGWMLGTMIIVMFVALLAWATIRKPSTGSPARKYTAFLVGGFLYVAVFTEMCWTYRNSLLTSSVSYLGPFPTSLSWLLFGIWWIPVFFVVLYSVTFHRWIYPEQNAERFERLIEDTVQSESETH